MRLCYSWLKELADFEWDPAELADKLSMSGTETVVSGPLFPEFTGVVVGKVEDCDPHPSADKLKVCKVDTGSTVLSTVCGAPNVRTGLKVAFAGPGAELPGNLAISAVDMRGVKSEGMICSETELGLSDDHSIIMELDRQLKIGTSLREALELDDWLLEFDLTPNRPDCLSAIGLAREIAALTGTKLKMPKIHLSETDQSAANEVDIAIENPQSCPRYMARVIHDIRIGQTPWWIKKKLYSAGTRSINNVVDITNLVLMECGHPLHAFDFDRFSAPKVVVRGAKIGEKFTTLDEVERTLAEGTVLITDSKKPVALGGIMGGLESEVSERTSNVLLESAYFDPPTIRKSGKQLGLTSESQLRFEKGADPNNVPNACDRAAYLIQKYAGGKVLAGQVDCYPEPVKPILITLRPARVNNLLATDLSSPQMIDILSALEFGVKTGKKLTVAVPSFRPDVTREIDLIEEIARIFGYDKVKTATAAGGTLLTRERPEERFKEVLRTALTSQGCVEALTNTLIDPVKDKVVSALEGHIAVLKPVSAELSVLRQNLLSSFLNIISYNLNRKKSDISFFEVGRVFIPSGDKLPNELLKLGIAFCGKEQAVHWDRELSDYDFFDLKGVLQSISSELRIGDLKLSPKESRLLEKSMSFDVLFGKDICGICGEVARRAREQYDIDLPVFYAEIDMQMLYEKFSSERTFVPVPKYPSSLRDLAVIVDNDVFSADLRDEIVQSGGELVTRVELFDIYEGKPIPASKKSLAYSIEYRSDSKTLTDEEVDTVHRRIIERLTKKFSAELR
ncbi:MAG: phenylalanine--tRNA ligase subunit beta [Candidatus Zixiibacteriota bacterium]